MKISVLTHNLSNNAFGRAFMLADILNRKYEIEIIGPVETTGIWQPLNDSSLKIKTVQLCNYPKFFGQIKQLLGMITGDVIYAIKPQPTSFGIGLIKKFRTKKPLVLDIDDWEEAFYRKKRPLSKLIAEPNSALYGNLMKRFIGYADDITIASESLMKIYGSKGVIVSHARDQAIFNPNAYSANEQKRKFDLEKFKLIVFAGTVTPHKGVEYIAEAIKLLNDKNIKLVIFDIDKDRIKLLKERYPEIVVFLGPVPFDLLPERLSMADLVVLPQKNDPCAVGQIPAKLIDAMAMAKPIISTNISDIPKILEGCGIIVEPGDVNAIARNIRYILDNPVKAEEMGKAARIKFEKYFSYKATEDVLYGIFDKFDKN